MQADSQRRRRGKETVLRDYVSLAQSVEPIPG